MSFYFFALFFKLVFVYYYIHFTKNLGPHFKTVFPVFFCFLCKAHKCLEACANCVWNCKTVLFTPLRSNFGKYFFQKHTPPPSEMRDLFGRWHLKDIKDLENQGPYKSQLCKKWVGSLHFRETWLAITFTWPNEP